MRYRYIIDKNASGDKHINEFCLFSKKELNRFDIRNVAIRIQITDDLKFTKYSCDTYATTNDTRLINEFSYDVVVKFNGIWKACKEYQNVGINDVTTKLDTEYCKALNIGYVTKEQYKNYHEKLQEKIDSEWKKAEALKKELKTRPYCIDEYRHIETNILLKLIQLYATEDYKKGQPH